MAFNYDVEDVSPIDKIHVDQEIVPEIKLNTESFPIKNCHPERQ